MKQHIILLITLMLMLTGCGDGAEVVGDSSDTTPPVITLIGEDEISLTQNAIYTEAGATATDDVDGDVSVTTTGSVDTTTVGVYTITYTATDSSGNSATATRTVNVLAASLENNQTTYKIVDTAQALCYDSATGATEVCAGKGYDADYNGNQPSYTLSAGGAVVIDNVTGLMWTQSTDTDGDGVTTDMDDKMSQSEAVTYCSELSLEGYDDWRLPDIKTAYSLILFSGEDPSGYSGSDTSGLVPFIDPVFSRTFGDTANGERIIDGQYATTSLYVSTTMNGDATMFGVNFVDGRIKGYPTQIMDFYVQCVRGGEDYGINDFTDNGDSTVSDRATGLMWEQNSSDSTDWNDAVEICEVSTTAGHTDWRLPDAKELQSIVDYTRSPDTNASAALDPLFNATSFENEAGETDWGSYWSSTTHANSEGIGNNAAYLSFGRALGYFNFQLLDVHGAGAQRSDDKTDESRDATLATVNGISFYYKGPQGDIRRTDNKVRCVRDDG